MKEFDFAAAWREMARPLYDALPLTIHDLIRESATHAAGLRQGNDLTMPWPSDDFRAAFAALPSDVLASAARTVHSAGHWYPTGGDLEIPGRQHGNHWKFSHYCDQTLRARFGLTRETQRGIGLAILEGEVRITWGSGEAWYWQPIGLATDARIADVRANLVPWFDLQIKRAGDGRGRTSREKRDSAAYAAMEAIKAGTAPGSAPDGDGWQTDRYMVEKTERVPPPADLARERADLIASRDRKMYELHANFDRMIALLDRGISTENAIYYPHTDRVCFGWRDKLTPAAVAALLDKLGAEYPYEYEIKGYAEYARGHR